jgi:hypothetical protein
MNWAGLGNSFQLFEAYAGLALVVTIVAVSLAKRRWAKWAAAVVVISVFWGLTLIDDVMGAREHRLLCEKEAGVKVYKQVMLPAEYYRPDGTPKFIEKYGQIYPPALAGYVKFEWRNQDSYAIRYLKIDKEFYSIIDSRTGELLAERISFRRWSSPFVPSIIHRNAIGCEDSEAYYELTTKFHRQVFPNRTAD